MTPARRLELIVLANDDAINDAPRFRQRRRQVVHWTVEEAAFYLVWYQRCHQIAADAYALAAVRHHQRRIRMIRLEGAAS